MVTQQQLDDFVKRWQKVVDEYHERQGYNWKTTLSSMVGKRYARIVSEDHGQRSASGFVDMSNGDILKAAGWFLDNNTEDEIMETLLHEIAHALTPGHGHDRVWKAKCIEIGGKGLTYYNQGDRNVVNPNKERTRSSKTYRVECQGCGYDFPFYTRKRKSNNLTHTGCGGKVECIEVW